MCTRATVHVRGPLLALAAAALAACGAPEAPPTSPRTVRAATKSEKEALLDPIKALEGDWNALDDAGRQVLTSQFRVTAGGSAVREVLYPGQPHETTNVYHMDGPDLVVTRYCAGGNQPRLRGGQGKVKGVIDLRADSVTDWGGGGEPYMGAARLRLLGPDHVIITWTQMTGAQASGETIVDLRRRR